MQEWFYWWIGMDVCTRYWPRHCMNYQALIPPRLTVRWPIISMSLPEGPGIAITVDYVSPLPVRRRGNTYILLITDYFSRRTDTFAVTAAEFTAEGTANFPINQYIPLCGCAPPYSRTTASSSAPSFHTLSTSCWEYATMAQAHIIQMVTQALSG